MEMKEIYEKAERRIQKGILFNHNKIRYMDYIFEEALQELGYDAKPNELNDGQYAKFWALAKKKFRLYDDDELLKKLTGDEEISFKSVQISDENEDEARKSVKEKYGEEAVKDFTFISTPLGMIAVGDGFLWEADIDDCEE